MPGERQTFASLHRRPNPALGPSASATRRSGSTSAGDLSDVSAGASSGFSRLFGSLWRNPASKEHGQRDRPELHDCALVGRGASATFGVAIIPTSHNRSGEAPCSSSAFQDVLDDHQAAIPGHDPIGGERAVCDVFSCVKSASADVNWRISHVANPGCMPSW
jgi:hypothetical protein